MNKKTRMKMSRNKYIFWVVAILLIFSMLLSVYAEQCTLYKNPKIEVKKDSHEPYGDHYNIYIKAKGKEKENWHLKSENGQSKVWGPGVPYNKGPSGVGYSPSEAFKNAGASPGTVRLIKNIEGKGGVFKSFSPPLEPVIPIDNPHTKPPTTTPYLIPTLILLFVIVCFLFIFMLTISSVSYKNKKHIFRTATTGFFIVSIIFSFLISADAACLAKIGVKVGGISTNISAQFLENLTDIKAVVYDPYLEELIFVGEENYSLSKVDLDDLAMALEVPKEDQWVDMDVDVDTSGVTFGDSRLVNSSTSYKLFSADYLLKNMTLDNVSDCVCWKRCGGDETRRIWIYPNESVLNITNNSFVWNKFSVSVSQEYLSGRSDNCTNECWNSWASHLANNFLNLSKDHEEWSKVISSAKTASIANWVKDNKINYSWFLENYTRNQNTTPSFVPTQHNEWWMCQCNGSDCGNCNVLLKFTEQGDSYTWVSEQFGYEDCSTYVSYGDDIYTTYNLPFNFPFYNNQYSSMYIHSNGYITFDSPVAGWSGFWSKFINHKMIALDTRDLITNIYVCNHQNYVTVRLTGGYYGKTTSVDVEALLYQNGTIKLMLKDVGAYTDYWGNGIITGVSNGTGKYTTATMDLYGGVTLDFNNTYVRNENVEAIKLATLLSRPWDDEVTWNVRFNGKNYTAVALSLGSPKQINYSVDYNTYHETPLGDDVDYNAYVVSIVPETLEISPGKPLNLNMSVQGKDIMANVSLKLVPLNSTHIQERNIISQNSFNTIALWEPPVNKNASLQMPSNLKRGSYQIYAETYVNGTLQDIAVSDYLYYTPINGDYVLYNATEYTVTNGSIVNNDCYADGNLSDCYMTVNYVKREGNYIEFSFNLIGTGDGLIYANENLIGNLSFYEDNYTFVIPNLNSSKTNIISIKIFDHEYEVYYILNITIPSAPWGNSSWKYRKPITLNLTTYIADYQVSITLNSTNFNFSKANPSGSDIRFIDGNKELNYWVESWNSTNAKIWIKVNLTANSTKTIYLYYRNPSATSLSNENVVFLIKDLSFEKASGDWIWGGPGNHKRDTTEKHHGSWSALTGFRDASNVANGYDYVYQDIIIPSEGQTILEFWWKFHTNDYCNYDLATMHIKDTSNNILATPLNFCCSGCSGYNVFPWQKVTYNLTPWAGQTIRLWFETANRVDTLFTTWTYYDHVLVRKYTSPEPSVSIGAEESN